METFKKDTRVFACKVGNFLKDNRKTIFSMGILFGAACVFGPDAMAANENYDSAFANMYGTMNKFQEFMTGPAPKAIGTIGIGMVGASWAFNIENQITKAGLRLFGGTGAAIGATNLISLAGTALVK